MRSSLKIRRKLPSRRIIGFRSSRKRKVNKKMKKMRAKKNRPMDKKMKTLSWLLKENMNEKCQNNSATPVASNPKTQML